MIAAVALIVVNVLRLRACGADVLGIPCDSTSKFFKFGKHGYAAVTRARKGLEKGGYLDRESLGYQRKGKKPGHTSRFAPTEAFIELLDDYELGPADFATSKKPRLVELREKDAAGGNVHLHWPREKQHVKQAAKRNLARINKALAQACIALHVPDVTLEAIQEKQSRAEDGKYVDFFGKELVRVYNETPEGGGRFYKGWWMNIPSEYRKHVHISAPGKHPAYAVELDYSAIQPRILYAEEGLPCTKDPYRIYSSELWNDALRPVIKKAFLAILNSDSRAAATKAVASEILDEHFAAWLIENPGFDPPPFMTEREIIERRFWPDCPSVPELLDKIEEAHAQIAAHFYTGVGLRLMNLDSTLAEAVMLRVIDELHTVALPVHDSFLVRHDYKENLRRIMDEEARRLFGVPFPVKQDETEFDPVFDKELETTEPLDLDVLETPEYAEIYHQNRLVEEAEYGRYHGIVDGWIAGQPLANRQELVRGFMSESRTYRQMWIAAVRHQRETLLRAAGSPLDRAAP